ncbi:hypothetical protein FHG08_07315 [Pseudoalteromonas sp. Scap03]|uniref:phosphatase domain-containing putative toxin n=1 Tax=unclassified Pseudoalteromonas TaxID=194690 RepID=UPI0015B8D522|nr:MULTISPECIES: hypothetical protein [unclassified Pseudoalteromonas]NWL15528.1 hypothetical protein [Pseudoalteromonas sp. Scap03]QLE80674.1 hypothetical protein FLM54_03580 [Pseudoalteromonas sp. Scap25]QLE88617.1 hypothetical protein FLM47_03580 [Pseudoalteromonas sp. Scap06]
MKLIKQLCTSVFIAAIAVSTVIASEQPVATDVVNNVSIKNFAAHNNLIFSAAQPTKEQFKQLSQAKVKHVINLRAADEQDWDEGALVNSLGMSYHLIEIAGAKDVNTDNAKQLANLLEQLKGESVVVHCASSNRVGALMAISAHQQGTDIKYAIEIGKQWGMASLEPVVRKVMNDK